MREALSISRFTCDRCAAKGEVIDPENSDSVPDGWAWIETPEEWIGSVDLCAKCAESFQRWFKTPSL